MRWSEWTWIGAAALALAACTGVGTADDTTDAPPVPSGDSGATVDYDGDGLSDAEEEALGTNPFLSDTDDDGLLDGEEVDAGTNPLDADTDDDGLEDGAERDAGTDPLVQDTDGGGVADGREVELGTDPTDPTDDDTILDDDADGLTNAREAALGTDPEVADTDGDALLDGEEVDTHETDPLNPDTDDDALTDGDEVLLGTSPTLRDTDGDGLDDWPEVNRTLTLGDDADSDGGGIPDGVEVFNGLDPNAAADDASTNLVLFADAMERAVPDPAKWQTATAEILPATREVARGRLAWSITGTGLAESVPFDASFCSALEISLQLRHGFSAPLDDLVLSLSDGTTDTEILRRVGDGTVKPWALARRTVSDPGLLVDGISLKLENLGASAAENRFHVDDVLVVCDPDGTQAPSDGTDADADGIPGLLDCDDGDLALTGSCGRCIDDDLDGFGRFCDRGPDCDDANVAIFPGASDPDGDGIDADCSGEDGPGLADDFESGLPIPASWAAQQGSVQMVETTGPTLVLELDGGDTLASAQIDTSGCTTVAWGLQLARTASIDDRVFELQYWTGEAWRLGARPVLAGTAPERLSGNLPDPAARHADFAILLVNRSESSTRRYQIDDLEVRCGGTDADGDGFDTDHDCDDADGDQWAACGACTDGDGDGYGAGCDRGPDCDDGDSAVYPGAADSFGDGSDTDCSGADGPGWADDFERGLYDPAVWQTTGGPLFAGALAQSGSGALELAGNGAFLLTRPLDTSSCPTIDYSVAVGDNAAAALDDLVIEYFDGAQWRTVARARSDEAPVWTTLAGSIADDPGAFRGDFQLRIRNTAPAGGRPWLIDDLTLGCGTADGDGDGVSATFDCDDGDRDQWSSCALCGDVDGDGRGLACDLGPDCDEGDPTVFVGASDSLGDGVDTDCSGSDGPGLFDDFDDVSTFSPAIWRSVTGGADLATGADGYLRFTGGAEIETVPVDMSACTDVMWFFDGFRATGTDGYDVVVSTWDGAGYVERFRWRRTLQDADPRPYFGIVPGAEAGSDFRLRLTYDSPFSGTATDYWIDDVGVACVGADGDGDGYPPERDCDDADPDLQLACATCVDEDGDGYGFRCDLPEDCHDGDAAIYPGAVGDALGDGVDQDCDGADGAALLADDFEAPGPAVGAWTGIEQVTTTTRYPATGAHAVALDTSSVLTSAAVDASGCAEVVYRYRVRQGTQVGRAPEVGDVLELAYDVGGGWVVADAVEGRGAREPYVERLGLLPAEAASASLTLQLRSSVGGDGAFYVDDVSVGCSDVDGDGDGFPSAVDCDDADGDRWASCGRCTDGDGDGFGDGCDRGPDCDDGASGTYPGAADSLGNGLDEDCSGVDGPGFVDDFERIGPDPVVWDLSTITGPVYYFADRAHDGAYSLALEGTGAIETNDLDTSSCSALWLDLRIADEGLAAGEELAVEYWDGAAWQLAQRGQDGDDWRRYATEITDPSAKSSSFRVRLRNTAVDTPLSEALVDDFFVGCGGPDTDADGIPAVADCDPADGARWFACATCVDVDMDGYGAGCDLPYDCDDGLATTSPDADDSTVDGVDQDCSGVDGPGLLDGFEDGAPGGVWVSIPYGWRYDATTAATGTYSLRATGQATAASVPQDMRGCSAIDWSYRLRREDAGRGPEVDDVLYLDWYDSTLDAWVQIDSQAGGADASFATSSGTISDPGARSTAFRIRFETDMASEDVDVDHDWVYIDDLDVRCVP